MGGLKIADAKDEQVSAILNIERECFSVPWTEHMLKAQIYGGDHIFLTAEMDGEVLGYIGLMLVSGEGYISNVAVKPGMRRQGIGSALIMELIGRARTEDAEFLTLEVRRSNPAAIELYEKHGFEEAGCRRGYYDKPAEDAIIMT